jgi:S-adenosylmethionine-diacylglycerol 3-amino-3-carboxypropyl transferase
MQLLRGIRNRRRPALRRLSDSGELLAIGVNAVRRTTVAGLSEAVHHSKSLSKAGLLERLFTFAFAGLVYPQIWEDPAVDMEALDLGPDDHVMTIASGGCNVLSYLVANPARITAVDLNGAHVALNRLKLCALRHLPDHAAFFEFFGKANCEANVDAYQRWLRPHLDASSRAYWEGRAINGRRRINHFTRNFYRYGALGNIIGCAHTLARIYGCDVRAVLEARSKEEQRRQFDRVLAPLFEKPFVKWILDQPVSLYGLGIPPAQYRALAGDSEGGMIEALRLRLRRLACEFDLSENYFAWQAFGRGYAPLGSCALPPYLEPQNFGLLQARCDRVETHHVSFISHLQSCADKSFDAYVLLDAQDWMTDDDLTLLWREITRTAKPGARVIFRTAADERLLPGRVPSEILASWHYNEAYCRDLTRRDRSSIYGGFHLYRLAQSA